MKSNGFIVVLVYIIKAAQSMTMIQAADEPMPLRIAPILKPPASSPPVHAKTAYTKHTNLRTQGQPPLIYGGNPVIHTPRVYLVFWGSQWINNDPSGEAAIITSLMQGIGGSTWLNTVTQYCSGTGVGSASCTAGSALITNPSSILKGVWYDNTAAAPTSPTQNQFGNEAVRAAIYFGQNTSALTTDAMYFIMSATGNNIAQFGSYYCAYHDYKAATFGNVAYANIPYITDAGYSCGAGFNGLGNNAGITMQVGHELVEMITNPLATGGWMDRNASEIGDKCQYIGTGSPGAVSNIQLPTGTFPLQSVWSNADAGCVSTFGTVAPTLGPTRSPTSPTIVPSRRPTAPTVTPSMTPFSPSIFPSFSPSNTPSLRPTRTPSNVPVKTVQPVFSKRPSRSPTFKPSTSLSSATVKTVSTGQGTTGSDNMILMLVIIVSVLVLLLLLLLLCTIIRRIRSARVSKQAINEDELEGALSNAGIHSRSPSRQNIDPTGAVSPNMSPSSSSRTRSMRGINSRGVSIRSRMVSVDSDIQDIMHNSSFREFAHKSDSDIKYDPLNSI